ncbi:MAG TPA: FKBP-type peptidyl-prolyl cis-trans isomerase [Pilimelia sp.]|nr:FKBP-type peptidyl-prolyl cis-trans isomerase [Pilimelia sp.]
MSGAARRIAEEMAAKQAAEARRRRTAWLGAGAAALVVAGAVVGILVLRSDDEPAGPPTVEASPSAAAPAAPAGGKPQVSAGTGTLDKLNVKVLKPGTGPEVKAGQTITVHYVGVTYADGKEFDSSWKTGQPAEFGIGTGQVIKGWDQGLVGQKVGSRVQLDIPADLAYGDSGGPVSGPLRFVVDVLAAK